MTQIFLPGERAWDIATRAIVTIQRVERHKSRLGDVAVYVTDAEPCEECQDGRRFEDELLQVEMAQ